MSYVFRGLLQYVQGLVRTFPKKIVRFLKFKKNGKIICGECDVVIIPFELLVKKSLIIFLSILNLNPVKLYSILF